MAEEKETKVCKYCKSEIPKKAKVCPNCRKKQGGIGKWIVIAVIVIIVIAAISGGGDDKDKTHRRSARHLRMTSRHLLKIRKQTIQKLRTKAMFFRWAML